MVVQISRRAVGGCFGRGKLCIVKQGKVLAALFLGGFNSSHLEGFISSYCMRASVRMRNLIRRTA